MAETNQYWTDRSNDPSGFSGSAECASMIEELNRLIHQMQAGVKWLMEFRASKGIHPQEDISDCGPKHLRVGVNNAMCEHAALVALLVDMGVIAYKDYLRVQLEFAEREVNSYKRKIKDEFGMDVELR